MVPTRRVVIDVDGVLAEFNYPFADLLRQQGAVIRPFKDPRGPEMWDWVEPYGATEEQLKAAWAHTVTYPGWWGTLPVHADMSSHLNRQKLLYVMLKDEVSFVTSRFAIGARDATVQWLTAYMGVDPLMPQVTVTPREKVHALMAMHPDIVIEDRLPTLEAYRTVNEKATLILVDRPWNQKVYDGNYLRVASTGEALSYVLEQR